LRGVLRSPTLLVGLLAMVVVLAPSALVAPYYLGLVAAVALLSHRPGHMPPPPSPLRAFLGWYSAAHLLLLHLFQLSAFQQYVEPGQLHWLGLYGYIDTRALLYEQDSVLVLTAGIPWSVWTFPWALLLLHVVTAVTHAPLATESETAATDAAGQPAPASSDAAALTWDDYFSISDTTSAAGVLPAEASAGQSVLWWDASMELDVDQRDPSACGDAALPTVEHVRLAATHPPLWWDDGISDLLGPMPAENTCRPGDLVLDGLSFGRPAAAQCRSGELMRRSVPRLVQEDTLADPPGAGADCSPPAGTAGDPNCWYHSLTPEEYRVLIGDIPANHRGGGRSRDDLAIRTSWVALLSMFVWAFEFPSWAGLAMLCWCLIGLAVGLTRYRVSLGPLVVIAGAWLSLDVAFSAASGFAGASAVASVGFGLDEHRSPSRQVLSLVLKVAGTLLFAAACHVGGLWSRKGTSAEQHPHEAEGDTVGDSRSPLTNGIGADVVLVNPPAAASALTSARADAAPSLQLVRQPDPVKHTRRTLLVRAKHLPWGLWVRVVLVQLMPAVQTVVILLVYILSLSQVSGWNACFLAIAVTLWAAPAAKTGLRRLWHILFALTEVFIILQYLWGFPVVTVPVAASETIGFDPSSHDHLWRAMRWALAILGLTVLQRLIFRFQDQWQRTLGVTQHHATTLLGLLSFLQRLSVSLAYWLALLALLLCGILPNHVTLLSLGYLLTFFACMFWGSGTPPRLAVWWAAIVYSACVLMMLYMFQFPDVRAALRARVSPALLQDLGLRQEETQWGLFQLLAPSTAVLVTCAKYIRGVKAEKLHASSLRQSSHRLLRQVSGLVGKLAGGGRQALVYESWSPILLLAFLASVRPQLSVVDFVTVLWIGLLLQFPFLRHVGQLAFSLWLQVGVGSWSMAAVSWHYLSQLPHLQP